jgi:hypothetical protein
LEIKLDILQNSKDYLIQSIELASIADEFGNHDSERADRNSKVKWKLGFICLVQATELLVKVILEDINQCLVYKDIDANLGVFSKTINLSIAINRLITFTDFNISEADINLIKKAIRFRNDFIHYEVKLHTEDLKTVYCRLLKLYTNIYRYFLDKEFYVDSYPRGYDNFMSFTDYLVPFRRREIRKDLLEEVKQEIIENQKYHFYIHNGIKYRRVTYGSELDRFPELRAFKDDKSIYEYKYCDDCSAKVGEYHDVMCDLERCPKCGGQRLTCECFDKYHYDLSKEE